MGHKRYSPELRERAIRLVLDHADKYPTQWEAVKSIAEKLGCSAHSLRRWVDQTQMRPAGTGLPPDDAVRLKQLEKENFELRRANEILRKASAYFAQAELDRHEK
jgi:transposase